jgi:hypothetical protein
LLPTLFRALETENVLLLLGWTRTNRSALVDPYEGKKLDVAWESTLTNKDVQEYGDFALTKYYDPVDSIGLDYDWQEIGEELEKAGRSESIILGTPVGPAGRLFDPGGSGSYFQSAGVVRANLESLREPLRNAAPQPAQQLSMVRDMLQVAATADRGLYITF